MEICPLLSILKITSFKLKRSFLFFIVILFMGCKNDAELSMERGIQFYEWNRIEEAVLEFKHVIRKLGQNPKKMENEELKLLSRAHHNLAVTYAKKKWYAEALDEAMKAFDLFPTDDNRKILELIQTKVLHNKTGLRSTPIDSISR